MLAKEILQPGPGEVTAAPFGNRRCPGRRLPALRWRVVQIAACTLTPGRRVRPLAHDCVVNGRAVAQRELRQGGDVFSPSHDPSAGKALADPIHEFPYERPLLGEHDGHAEDVR